MTIFSMLGFTMLVLLVAISFFYLLWISKRQKLELQSYELHKTMQKHFQQMDYILSELEPLMAHDKAFYEQLQTYVKAHHSDFPVLGEVDDCEAKEFYSFLLHLEQDSKEHIKIFSSPITQQLAQMKLSLMRARESFSYADNEYKVLTSSFPISILARLLEQEPLPRRSLQY